MLNIKIATLSMITGCLVPFAVQADQTMSQTKPQEQATYVPGEIVKTGNLPAGYNASATYQCLNRWDIFITADYIYWNWQQESFQIGVLDPGSTGTHEAVFQNPGYASGFQVGLGFNMPGMDDWNLYSEYTWYRNSDTNSTVSSDAQTLLVPTYHDDSLNVSGTTTSEVKMHFDALDFLIKRPFYFGKKLIANVSMGLNALWITQKFERSINGFNIDGADTFPLQGSSLLDQTSWGLGPKFGLETNWMLGCGFQIMGNLSTSVLYTRYNVTADLTSLDDSTSFEFLNNYNVLKPITEAFLGLGWNTGFCDNSYRLALSAGYDFNVYWNYNMKDYAVKNQKTVGDMYLQGLNVGVRFDF